MNKVNNAIFIIILCGLVTFIAFKSNFETKIPNNELNDGDKKSLSKSVANNNTTYQTTVNYEVPEKNQTLTLSLTLQNNIVINSVVTQSMHGKSREYQEDFEKSYKVKIIGKNINDINLSRIGGASLTTNAFNQAINIIKSNL